jgi:hypothetical protein
MHYEKAPRLKRSRLDVAARYRVERTSFRAGVASAAEVQRLHGDTITPIKPRQNVD